MITSCILATIFLIIFSMNQKSDNKRFSARFLQSLKPDPDHETNPDLNEMTELYPDFMDITTKTAEFVIPTITVSTTKQILKLRARPSTP